jgi:hypothetical protein
MKYLKFLEILSLSENIQKVKNHLYSLKTKREFLKKEKDNIRKTVLSYKRAFHKFNFQNTCFEKDNNNELIRQTINFSKNRNIKKHFAHE